jgi:hypothetical protein
MAAGAAHAREGWWRLHPVGAVLAVLAASRHLLLMTSSNNDNFVHLTLAQQLLAGDWPVRDFFDNGWVLQYTLSAAAQLIGGERLMSEAVVVATAWAVSTYLVFQLVRRLTGSTVVSVVAALLLIVAGARGYSYPKGIVYVVAAVLWWRYVDQPTLARIAGFGAWAAVAFYWRPDHGIYVAVGLALAVLAVNGVRRVSVVHCLVAAATMVGLLVPFLLYVQIVFGLQQYAETGGAAAVVEHTTQGTHEWPLLRLTGRIVTIDPVDAYTPVVGIRWSQASSDDSRRDVLERYGLTVLSRDGESVRVGLSARSLPLVRALVNEPIVEDTAGIDRSTGALMSSSWPADKQRAFEHAWLRLRILPDLEGSALASELTVALFYLLPIVVVAAARPMSKRLADAATAGRLIAFAAFAFLVDFAMLRAPFAARAADAVALSAILFGCCVAWMWRAAAGGGHVRGALLRTLAIVLVLAGTTSVAADGRFNELVRWLAGQATSWQQAREDWGQISSELVSSPPLRHYLDRRARLSLRLAAYVRECLPPSDRVLVLWFEPEIYYFSGHLMAQRHIVFAPAWSGLEHEQRATLAKIAGFAPPIALARQSALDDYAVATFPGVVDYVRREYQPAATITDGGEQYLIFARRDRPVLRGFGAQGWPCFVRETSLWSRVGKTAE